MKNKNTQFVLPCCAFAFLSFLTFGIFLVANGILDFSTPQASYQSADKTEIDKMENIETRIKKLESKTICGANNCGACEYAECSSIAGCWWKEIDGLLLGHCVKL